MSLDLASIIVDWSSSAGGVCARLIRDAAGGEHVQMRIEMGVLQMRPSGRPDGKRHRGHSTVLAHIRHEMRIEEPIEPADWAALEREFQQFNYRRLAYAALAEFAIQADDAGPAIDLLNRTLRDIDHCIATLRVMQTNAEDGRGPHAAMLPALLFNRARLRARRCTLHARFEDAIDATVAGLSELEDALVEIGFDDEQRSRDPGMAFLRQCQAQLRQKHGIAQTLRERLQKAIADENFPLAAGLHDELQRREKATQPKRQGPPDA